MSFTVGALTLDMNRFPRGAKSSKLCTLDMLKTDGSVPQMSLFKHKRVKGWWPFHVKNEGEEMELTVMFGCWSLSVSCFDYVSYVCMYVCMYVLFIQEMFYTVSGKNESMVSYA